MEIQYMRFSKLLIILADLRRKEKAGKLVDAERKELKQIIKEILDRKIKRNE